MYIQVAVCLSYMVSSSALTTVNKVLYEKLYFSSPLNLFMVQCFCNVCVCMLMMSYKSFVDPKAFQSLEKLGLRITTLGETFGKCRNGFIIGSLNIVTVLFGLFSVKHVNIPMFLTFRRCQILAVVITTFFIKGEGPTRTVAITAFIICSGAVLAGYETFDDDSFGYMLIWGNNFAQSIYNVIASIYNQEKKIVSFEINFFFALIGLPLMIFLTYYTGEMEVLTNALSGGRLLQRGFIMISGVSGIMITVSSILTVTLCGTVAPNVAGTIKDVGLTFVGFLFFKTNAVTIPVFTGISMSFIGAGFFAYSNYQEKLKLREKNQQVEKEAASAESKKTK